MDDVRLIDANALMKRICEHECGMHPEDCDGMESKTVPCNFHAYVSEAPTVDAVPVKLYHVTTPKKAKRYRETGAILKPVRGFTTLDGAMAWAIKTGRTVIYEVEGAPAYKLPDHHNKFGDAWWIDSDVPVSAIKCVRFE